MRDRRFVAVHRGGPLEKPSHVFLAKWAADCAEEVLHLFQQHSSDDRPEKAIEIARNWASGGVKTGVAMKASLASHAAAREAKDKAAIAAARAAGHAVATAHFADHSLGALLYALKAMEAVSLDSERELQKQLAKLPDNLREQVEYGINIRLAFFVTRKQKRALPLPQEWLARCVTFPTLITIHPRLQMLAVLGELPKRRGLGVFGYVVVQVQEKHL